MILFALPDGHPALALAEEYGFSEANPMTLEWVLEHPKKTCQMIYIDEDVMYAIRRKRLERSKY